MKAINIHDSIMRSGDETIGRIALEGELTLIHAAEIKRKLEIALQSNMALLVSIQKVTAIDLSCVQLLCSLLKSSALLNKSVTFDMNVPPETESLLTKAGFKMLFKCETSINRLNVK